MPFVYNPLSGRFDIVAATSGAPLPVSGGGTGRATLTDGSILVGNGTSPITMIGPLTDGQLLIGNTAGVDPSSASLTAPAAGITITGGAGTITFALANDLAALEALATTGMAARTAASTWTTRTITAGSGVSVADGDGVAGNPTISLGSTVPTTFTEDAGSAAPAANNINILGTSAQGLTTSGAGSTITLTNADWTIAQKGVGVLATVVEATVGASTTKAVTPQGLATKLGSQTAHAVLIAEGTTTAFTALGPTATAGQVLQSGGAAADPAFSTATFPATATGTGTILRADGTNWVATTSTYPNTNAVSTLLYASASNVMSALATANNGTLVTSNTGVPSILAGPGSTGNILQSNAAAAPSFSTATYPAVATGTGTLLRADGTNWVATTSTYPTTNAVSTLLYASASNVMSALATANNGVLITGTTGIPSILANGTTGQLLTATTGSPPSWATSTAAKPINLGINYVVGTGVFTINAADGTALSASNVGTIILPSKATPGKFTTYTITANQSFIDDNGASEIINNLFGLTTGVAYTQDIPFFIYAVTDDTEALIQFMISRVPHATSSPAVGTIGTPASAVADTQGSFFSIDTVTVANYDTNPCACIGSFRMRMSAADDWTVQTLDNADGIGLFQEGRIFSVSTGSFGATAGGFLKANGGTAPQFTTNNYFYSIQKNGIVKANYFLLDDAGTDGAGGVTTLLINPYVSAAPNDTYFGTAYILTATLSIIVITQTGTGAGATAFVYQLVNATAIGVVVNSDFGNGNRGINGNNSYQISLA